MSSESDSDEFHDALDETPKSPGKLFLELQTQQSVPLRKISAPALISSDHIHGHGIELQSAFKVPLPVSSAGAAVLGRKPYQKKAEVSGPHSNLRVTRGGTDETSNTKEDTCSSLSGSLLGNLQDDDDEASESPKTRASAVRMRRRQAAMPVHQSSAPHLCATHDDWCDDTTSGDACDGCIMQPFRVVEPDSSSLYSSISAGKVSKSTSGTFHEANQSLLSDHHSPWHDSSSLSCSAAYVPATTFSSDYTQLPSSSLPQSSSPILSASPPPPPDSSPPPSPTSSEASHQKFRPINVNEDQSDSGLCTGLGAEPDLVASTKTRSSSFDTGDEHRTHAEEQPLVVPAHNLELLNLCDTKQGLFCSGQTNNRQFVGRTGFCGIPFSSQSLPASSQAPRPTLHPLSLASRQHKSHPALLHIALLDPLAPNRKLPSLGGVPLTAGDETSTPDGCMSSDSFDGKCHLKDLTSNATDDQSQLELCGSLLDHLSNTTGNISTKRVEEDEDQLLMPPPPPVAPPRIKRKKKKLSSIEKELTEAPKIAASVAPQSVNGTARPLSCTAVPPSVNTSLLPISVSTNIPHISVSSESSDILVDIKKSKSEHRVHADVALHVINDCNSPTETRVSSAYMTGVHDLLANPDERWIRGEEHLSGDGESSIFTEENSYRSSYITTSLPENQEGSTECSTDRNIPQSSLPDAPATDLTLISDTTNSQNTIHVPSIMTTLPSPPVTPVSTNRSLQSRLSSIAKRPSKLLRTKPIVPSWLSHPMHSAGYSHNNNPPTSADSSVDAISIGRRSLDIRAAIRGKFLVKDSGRSSPSGSPDENACTHTSSHSSHRTEKKKKKDSISPLSDSDQEILSQVPLVDLDTGIRTNLNQAVSMNSNPVNPLSLQIMRLTDRPGEGDHSDDTSSIASSGRDSDTDSIQQLSHALSKTTGRMKKLLEKRVTPAMRKAAKTIKSRSDDKDVFADDAPTQRTGTYVKIKTAHGHKGPHEWDDLMYVQEITGEHQGPIWCAKFSLCGRLLATAGQDQLLRVWVIKQAYSFFLDIRSKYNPDLKVSPTPSEESLSSSGLEGGLADDPGHLDPADSGHSPFMPRPFCVYQGHSADLLDIAWSKNYFLLTSSMDKTVRLWHISRKECLCIFQHVDFVTAIAFHPKDDRYFISGSLDGKLRLWSIPEKRVVLWTEVEGAFITAANFCQNGAYTVVGTYDGRCLFYTTNQLKYNTQFNVRSARGKNPRGRKITGIEPLPGENKILVTSNDSRIRLYGLDEHSEHCKYRGFNNPSSQIRASFSHDGKYIVAGSENPCIYLWKTHHDYGKFNATARRDRNAYWEGVKAHHAMVTCALFSPHPELVFSFIELQEQRAACEATPDSARTDKQHKHDSLGHNKGYMLVSADFHGCIRVFLKKEKPKHSSLPASALT
ncbi:WD repeat-containing protein 44 isoform X2 [Hyalella azteca]|uniref:WD repeat-containing protein 44 n=1 Tax=Hyalella azteca TaxID=294128 RepID=A0A979FVU8_HYAAZ|nr:WD repeat-containing protein 44 isoform X2 [Hyalella azteca]